MKTLRNVLCIVLSLAAVSSFALFDSTYAWLAFSESVGMDANIGRLDFDFVSPGFISSEDTREMATEIDGETINVNYILPGDNLVAGVVEGTNKSSIRTDVRVQVKYTRYTAGNDTAENDVVYTDEASDLTVDFSDAWSYSEDDGCWHLTLEPNSGKFIVFNSMFYEEAHQSAYKGKTVSLSYVVQAKQADNVTWTQIASDVAELSLS